MKLVELAGLAVEESSGAPMLILQEREAPHRLLPIFLGGPEALSIASSVSDEPPARPLTHDLMATLIETLDAKVDAAEVTELRDGAFMARLTVRGADGEHQLDSRPSDAIALAVRVGAPLLVSEAVLDEAGSLPDELFTGPDIDQPALATPMLDEETINETLDDFRTFLDDVDPNDFGLGPPEDPSDQ